jgi:hypothetical protein
MAVRCVLFQTGAEPPAFLLEALSGSPQSKTAAEIEKEQEAMLLKKYGNLKGKTKLLPKVTNCCYQLSHP